MLSAEKAYERRWYTLAVLCMSLVIITIDNSILNVALPTIVRDLGASGSDLQWIIDSYVIVFASLLLTAGALGDKYGRKGALTFGLLLFGGFSGLASLGELARDAHRRARAHGHRRRVHLPDHAVDPHQHVHRARAGQGDRGVGRGLGDRRRARSDARRDPGRALLLGLGVLRERARSASLALVLGYFYIPSSRDPDNRPLDPVGALLSILTLVALLYSIIQAPDKGWTAPEVVASFFAGLALLGVFAVWEMHAKEPMIDVRVFRNPRFSAASGVLTLTSFALYGSVFLLIQYFQFVLGYSPLEAGLLAMPVAIAMMVVSPNAPRLVRRWGTKWVVVLGLLVAALAMLCYASDMIMSSFVGGCAVRLLFGVGLGLTSAPATESIMGSLPPSRAGVGSAINDTTRQTGGALGVAIIGSVFLAAYHHYADKAANLSTASRAALHDSVGRALDLARPLPAKQGAALVQLSRDAFVDAMRITYPIAAAIHPLRRDHRLAVPPRPRRRRVPVARRRRGSARDQRVRDPGRVASRS